jgi:hypothetical protein
MFDARPESAAPPKIAGRLYRYPNNGLLDAQQLYICNGLSEFEPRIKSRVGVKEMVSELQIWSNTKEKTDYEV